MEERLKSSVAPEILFIERCMQWLSEGGRMAIVLPDGILGNPADEYIRYWIMKNTWILASIDLPIECFIVEANVNILTSLLVLKKKTTEQRRFEALNGPIEYPIFMAVAEKVGFDRRGNPVYKRSPDGEVQLFPVETRVRTLVRDGRAIPVTHTHLEPEIDNDLPRIVEKYREFRERYPEPGQ
jgi:type I restriction enzyme M protein